MHGTFVLAELFVFYSIIYTNLIIHFISSTDTLILPYS